MTTLTAAQARAFLVSFHGLARPMGHGHEGVRAWLGRIGCIQIDPLDRIGTNADLVAMARIDGLKRNDVYDALLPGFAFEHFAKERCLLPAGWFPWWRAHTVETPWWRLAERHQKLDPDLVAAVLAEVRLRGPLRPTDLDDRGRVEAMDWHGWKGTGKAATLALEVLWTRGDVVVCRRTGTSRWHDVPERALPRIGAGGPQGAYMDFALVAAVQAAGLLGWPGGQAVWSVLKGQRAVGEAAVARGAVEAVRIEGSAREWLAPAGFRDQPWDEPDDRMRILPPLDTLLWDRNLVRLVFGMDYVWEIYKPARQRKFGWYTMPLLFRGQLVGRLEASYQGGEVRVEGLWAEDGVVVDAVALRTALERHAEGLS